MLKEEVGWVGGSEFGEHCVGEVGGDVDAGRGWAATRASSTMMGSTVAWWNSCSEIFTIQLGVRLSLCITMQEGWLPFFLSLKLEKILGIIVCVVTGMTANLVAARQSLVKGTGRLTMGGTRLISPGDLLQLSFSLLHLL